MPSGNNTTCAPLSTAPELSTTVPEIDPLGCCAKAIVDKLNNISRKQKTTRRYQLDIEPLSLPGCCVLAGVEGTMSVESKVNLRNYKTSGRFHGIFIKPHYCQEIMRILVVE